MFTLAKSSLLTSSSTCCGNALNEKWYKQTRETLFLKKFNVPLTMSYLTRGVYYSYQLWPRSDNETSCRWNDDSKIYGYLGIAFVGGTCQVLDLPWFYLNQSTSQISKIYSITRGFFLGFVIANTGHKNPSRHKTLHDLIWQLFWTNNSSWKERKKSKQSTLVNNNW